LVFGKAKLNVEDVIAALQPDYADLHDEATITQRILDRVEVQRKVLHKDTMTKAEGVLVDVIRSMANDDPDFLATFVMYVLGYDYLPVEVPIVVEFTYNEFRDKNAKDTMEDDKNQNNALPMAHTCVHVLKLPGTAYDADEHLIRTKLTMSLDYLKNTQLSFNTT
jgi:hypothetical protein